MKIWAGHLTYNTDEETGKFYDVIGETRPHIIAKPGMLTTNNPFHFEGEWAERIGAKYILHDGFITNCKMPKPWWRLRGKTFDIVPGERAIAHNSTFLVRKMPLFYAPFFYHSLEKEPRKSGFLMPLIGHSSRRGWMVHAGYFWAINRSYDVTYRGQYYTTRGLVHHVDFRGKPRAGTDYDVILYGVQDRGAPDSGTPPQKYSGISLLAVGKSDLGKGWTARGQHQLHHVLPLPPGVERILQRHHRLGNPLGRLRQQELVHLHGQCDLRAPAEFPVVRNRHHQTLARSAAQLRGQRGDHPQTPRSGIHQPRPADLGPSCRSISPSIPRPACSTAPSRSSTGQHALVDTFQTGQFMNRSSISPHVTGAFHLGGHSPGAEFRHPGDLLRRGAGSLSGPLPGGGHEHRAQRARFFARHDVCPHWRASSTRRRSSATS